MSIPDITLTINYKFEFRFYKNKNILMQMVVVRKVGRFFKIFLIMENKFS